MNTFGCTGTSVREMAETFGGEAPKLPRVRVDRMASANRSEVVTAFDWRKVRAGGPALTGVAYPERLRG